MLQVLLSIRWSIRYAFILYWMDLIIKYIIPPEPYELNRFLSWWWRMNLCAPSLYTIVNKIKYIIKMKRVMVEMVVTIWGLLQQQCRLRLWLLQTLYYYWVQTSIRTWNMLNYSSVNKTWLGSLPNIISTSIATVLNYNHYNFYDTLSLQTFKTVLIK